MNRYEKNLVNAKKAGIRRGMLTAVGVGVTYLVFYSNFGLGYWYGLKLILDGRESGTFDYTPKNIVVVS